MKLSYIANLNWRKLVRHPIRSLFLILPISLLLAVSIIFSSQSLNYSAATDKVLFVDAENSSPVIIVKDKDKNILYDSFDIQDFNESDLDNISDINGLKSSSIVDYLPINRIKNSDIFDQSITLNRLSPVDSSIFKAYSEYDYSDSEATPIILNSKDFRYIYEEWDEGKSEVRIKLGILNRPDPEDTPIRVDILDYNKDELLGKEIEVSFGGLTDSDLSAQSIENQEIVIRKKTLEEVDEEKELREEKISKYWDYDKIEEPFEQKFVVAGLIEDPDFPYTLIEKSEGEEIFKKYLNISKEARNENEINIAELGKNYIGIPYSGDQVLSYESMVAQTQIAYSKEGSYVIPGLVLDVVENNIGTGISSEEVEENSLIALDSGSVLIKGIYEDDDVWENTERKGDVMFVEVDNPVDRQEALKDLDEAGYPFADTLFDYEVFEELANTVRSINFYVFIFFCLICALIVFIALGKFVSENRQETGLMQAIGANRGDVSKLFVTQAVMYVSVAILIGVVIGWGGVKATASTTKTYFSSYIDNVINKDFNVAEYPEVVAFNSVNWVYTAIFVAIIIALTFLLSLYSSYQESRMAPVEAMKGQL